jgi:cytosine/adenosine deaminase-related metal-dependent hydrolase
MWPRASPFTVTRICCAEAAALRIRAQGVPIAHPHLAEKWKDVEFSSEERFGKDPVAMRAILGLARR